MMFCPGLAGNVPVTLVTRLVTLCFSVLLDVLFLYFDRVFLNA